jgi:hypothetical protein
MACLRVNFTFIFFIVSGMSKMFETIVDDTQANMEL